MKQNLLFVFLILLISLNSCKKAKDVNPIEEKSKMQSELIQSYLSVDSIRKIGVVDTNIFLNFVDHAKIFGLKYPEEPIVPKYLLEAGRFMKIMADIADNQENRKIYAKEAIEIFNNIQKIYPEYEGVKACIYFRGTTYDLIQDYKSAEIEFRDYIHKYPDDTLSVSLKEYLNFGLGKSEEEIYQEIVKKNKSRKN
ncbi:MAG: hypothetical protein H6Q25_690 [Bacteroidetes bacterium]|nr:hypothetical protein [Bacteroidota bacterium]